MTFPRWINDNLDTAGRTLLAWAEIAHAPLSWPLSVKQFRRVPYKELCEVERF